MAANRWLIVIGLTILIAMLVTVAFALGVYVGEKGWTQGGLRNQPGGLLAPGKQPPVQAPTPGGKGPPPPALPPGRPQLAGRIRLITPELLELATGEGPRQVVLTAETRFLDENGAPIPRQALQPGDQVGVFGRPAGDGSGQFLAEAVVRLPRP